MEKENSLKNLMKSSSQEPLLNKSWSQLLISIKQCEALSSSTICQKYIDALIERLSLSSESCSRPSSSSPDSYGIRMSLDSKSSESLKSSSSHATWWFDPVSELSSDSIKVLVKSMVWKGLNHSLISKFLFHYMKSYSGKGNIVETVVDLLYILDWNSFTSKRLLGLFLSNRLIISKVCKEKLENMIASQMDELHLDDVLVAPPAGTNYLYDVNLVRRLLRSFMKTQEKSSDRVEKVAELIDSYMAEVAPDPFLKPSKLISLVLTLPDFARASHDGIYRAIDLYLEVHGELREEDRINVCGLLNYEKLSAEAFADLSRNKNFTHRSVVHALISRHVTMKKVVRNVDVSSENRKMKAQMQEMRIRVGELESACRNMRLRMAKMNKSRARSLPMLCS